MQGRLKCLNAVVLATLFGGVSIAQGVEVPLYTADDMTVLLMI